MFSVSNAMLVGPASFSAMHPSAMQIFLCLFGSDLPFRLVLEESQNIFGPGYCNLKSKSSPLKFPLIRLCVRELKAVLLTYKTYQLTHRQL